LPTAHCSASQLMSRLEKKGTGSKRIDLLKVYYCPVCETTMHLGTDELRIALINLMFAAAHKTGSGTNRRIAGAQQLGRKRGEADMPRASRAGLYDADDPTET
jgi:hypothetical protein